MKFNKIIFSVGLLLLMLAIVQCKKVITYHAFTSCPRAVYIGDTIQRLPLMSDVYKERAIYVEVSERDGDKLTGKLMEISEATIVVAKSYYFSKKDDSRKIDNIVQIPKNDIILLKVW